MCEARTKAQVREPREQAGSGQGKVGAAAAAGTGNRSAPMCTLRSLPQGWAPDSPCPKQTLTKERVFLQGF